MKRSRGTLSRATRKLKLKRKLTAIDMLKQFNIGDKVVVEPVINQKGLPHPRFKGKLGTIVGIRGKSYEVEIHDFERKKLIVVPPVHLKKLQISR
ncbi:MAG: 50S ribosomal protein L21e [Candidatus Micrarchaeota archaeon]|nr:50S ribosomal protein L21e [Candidatus Micrarchaeota archaeon]